MKAKQGSLGSKIMIAQEQYNHMKRLNQICQKPRMITSNTYQPNYEEIKYKRLLHSQSAKLQNFQEINHMRTIKHLIERLNCPKTIQDRIKDPHDFFVYPTLFFRQTPIKKIKAKKGKQNAKVKKSEKSEIKKNQLNRIKSQNRFQPMKNKPLQNQKHNGLTFEKVKSQIPFLYFFQQENLQQFADALTKLIFNYSLNSLNDIQFLYECVQKAMPPSYPQQFRNAVDEMFTEIAQSLGIGIK